MGLKRSILAAGFSMVLFLTGCGGGGSDSGGGGSSGTGSTTSFWELPQVFSVVSTGRGVTGSAVYTPGRPAVILSITSDEVSGRWDFWYLSGAEPTNRSTIQLVLVMNVHKEDVRIFYTNGANFHHATAHAELRVALTGALIDSADFAGDNVAPRTISFTDTKPSDERSMVPAVEAWIAKYK